MYFILDVIKYSCNTIPFCSSIQVGRRLVEDKKDICL